MLVFDNEQLLFRLKLFNQVIQKQKLSLRDSFEVPNRFELL